MRPTLMRHTSSLKVFEMPIAGEVARERLLVTVAAWRGAGALGGAGAHTELGDVPIRGCARYGTMTWHIGTRR